MSSGVNIVMELDSHHVHHELGTVLGGGLLEELLHAPGPHAAGQPGVQGAEVEAILVDEKGVEAGMGHVEHVQLLGYFLHEKKTAT